MLLLFLKMEGMPISQSYFTPVEMSSSHTDNSSITFLMHRSGMVPLDLLNVIPTCLSSRMGREELEMPVWGSFLLPYPIDNARVLFSQILVNKR